MKKYISKAINPLRFFINDSRATGVILILCTVCSLLLSNSRYGEGYRGFWNMHNSGLAGAGLPETPAKLINDLLMSFFFLLAGMEIKRELLAGELSSFKNAVLPFGAALGGMVVPALIFLIFNAGTATAHGWGIPTATDIAFSIGVASLFGKRIPVSLKILLMALAIIDDLGAIVVIALFYGGQIQWEFLLISGLLYSILLACAYFKVKFGIIQILTAVLLWYTVLQSGVEAGITGVLVAFAFPLNVLPKIEAVVHYPVHFFVIPLFALCNTAIVFHGNLGDSLNSNISMGVIYGLVLGKPIGIFLFSWLLVYLKIAKLPHQVSWKQLFGMGLLAGIGFTMSIFTTGLAFESDESQNIAKISILTAVVLSTVLSWLYFRTFARSPYPIKNFNTENNQSSEATLALG